STTMVQANGSWSVSIPQADLAGLSNGVTYNVTASVSDQAGNQSSDNPSISVDTSAPAAPVVSGITPHTGPNSSDEITNSTTVTVNGTAEANSTVTLFNSATPIGTASADGGGKWSLSGVLLSEGTNNLTATATDAAGNTSGLSAALTVTLDTHGPTGWR